MTPPAVERGQPRCWRHLAQKERAGNSGPLLAAAPRTRRPGRRGRKEVGRRPPLPGERSEDPEAILSSGLPQPRPRTSPASRGPLTQSAASGFRAPKSPSEGTATPAARAAPPSLPRSRPPGTPHRPRALRPRLLGGGRTMSPGSGVKSEYMKRYREPCWDEYAPCYRERLHYRLGRRLLEQAHAPWLWDDWGPAGASDDSASSASSGAGSPAPQCAPDSPPPPAEPGAPEEPARDAEAGDAEAGDAEAGDAEAGDAEAGDAEATSVSALPVKDVKEKPEQPVKTKETDRLPSCEARQQQGAVFGRGAGKAVRSPQRSSSKTKEKKRPFALYGWGEKQMDTGSQRTHNVLASAPVSEIHESALRAQTRRQVERSRLAAQRQRALSDGVEGSRRTRPASSENPWVTEYMRCYSARA
ncbi:centriole, cilia and spindle-associated protein isoform X2 [Rhinolophus ferrumequinum]|uniref:centriole, cilia and spindle-associated protein isoform X2 n=1 Tax=Rhinolophus ferrumequinum TaxID=59479 RepID=UPI00140F741C|nr:centriole, cilia and spindle-associated protein isoform X2 [Rhinolophus ferrumequinum]